MACSGDWRKGRGAKNCRERRYEPIPVRAAKHGPMRDGFRPRRQPYLGPNGSQGKKEYAVHYTFQMCGKSHPYVGEMLLGETS